MADAVELHLICGLVGSGKTTLARQLAQELAALRLSRDEWMIRLYGSLPWDGPAYVQALGPCTELLWDVALEVAGVGASVVLDWNFWSRARRAEALARGVTAGVPVRLHWLDVDLEVAVQRAKARLLAATPLVHPITEDGIRHFATIFEPPTPDEGLSITVHR